MRFVLKVVQIIEGWKGVKFGWDYARGKPGTHASDENKIPTGFDIEDAFAAEPSKSGTSIPMMETQRERPQAAPKSHDSTIHNQPTEALVPWREEHFVSEPHPYSSQQHRLQYRFPPSLHEEGGENFTSQASMFNRTRSEGHVRSDSLPSQRGFLDPRDSYYNDETLEIPWEQRRQNSSPNQDHPFVGVAQ